MDIQELRNLNIIGGDPLKTTWILIKSRYLLEAGKQYLPLVITTFDRKITDKKKQKILTQNKYLSIQIKKSTCYYLLLAKNCNNCNYCKNS